MYIPSYYKQKDIDKTIAFMQAYNFASLISIQENIPIATHLPFIIEKESEALVLYSHLSKANPQWKTFSENNILVIFSEPHAYISPSLYSGKQEVPTWNYVAVHAYGKISILPSDEEKLAVLHKQMQSYEAEYIAQFKALDHQYIQNLLQGIVAFKLEITDLQAKEKLSQNKNDIDRKNVKQHLLESDDTNKQALGNMMAD